MKIFALYLSLDLTTKPAWFDSFREKNSTKFSLHVTLVQPRYIEESQIEGVKSIVEKVLKDFTFTAEDKKVVFEQTEIEKEADGNYLFLWLIKNNPSILSLQKKLVEALKDFNNYCDPTTIEYELDFKPHMTVADQIVNNTEVHELLSQNAVCEGTIHDLILPIVDKRGDEDPENLVHYSITE